MPFFPQKEEIEQEAQEKIEDTKHDIDEAAHNPVSSLACYYIMLSMDVCCPQRAGAYIRKLPAFRPASVRMLALMRRCAHVEECSSRCTCDALYACPLPPLGSSAVFLTALQV